VENILEQLGPKIKQNREAGEPGAKIGAKVLEISKRYVIILILWFKNGSARIAGSRFTMKTPCCAISAGKAWDGSVKGLWEPCGIRGPGPCG